MVKNMGVMYKKKFCVMKPSMKSWHDVSLCVAFNETFREDTVTDKAVIITCMYSVRTRVTSSTYSMSYVVITCIYPVAARVRRW
jgi:hypothetical protein